MDDRKKMLGDLADVALQLWALTQALGREPSPNWSSNAAVIEDQAEALRKIAAEVRARG